jgi:hypothetical protein
MSKRPYLQNGLELLHVGPLCLDEFPHDMSLFLLVVIVELGAGVGIGGVDWRRFLGAGGGRGPGNGGAAPGTRGGGGGGTAGAVHPDLGRQRKRRNSVFSLWCVKS